MLVRHAQSRHDNVGRLVCERQPFECRLVIANCQVFLCSTGFAKSEIGNRQLAIPHCLA